MEIIRVIQIGAGDLSRETQAPNEQTDVDLRLQGRALELWQAVCSCPRRNSMGEE